MKRDTKKILIVILVFFVIFALRGCSISGFGKKEAKKVNQDRIDSDGDGLFDYEELSAGTKANNKDTDGDGLSDYDELRKWSTDPNKADTDGDGASDGEEVTSGYDPNNKTAQLDPDQDGLGTADEKKLGTEPDNPDTDGDGFSDKQEVDAKRDPLDPNK